MEATFWKLFSLYLPLVGVHNLKSTLCLYNPNGSVQTCYYTMTWKYKVRKIEATFEETLCSPLLSSVEPFNEALMLSLSALAIPQILYSTEPFWLLAWIERVGQLFWVEYHSCQFCV